MTRPHPLDRPIWSSLTSRQAHLAQGDGRALRFAPDYGMFAAAANDSAESLAAVAAMARIEGGIALVEADPGPDPPDATVATKALVNQMVLRDLPPGEVGFAFEDLTDDDAAEMLALATLTRPGPFFARTHQLGRFIGVKRDGRLVAMAGERMKPDGFTEVSGVCTHPDARGHGYGGGLSRVVTARILARGEVPFLHVYAHNTGAIGLYETLGFELRRTLTMTVLTGA
jgi:predicted GNAT family acetyltransferase